MQYQSTQLILPEPIQCLQLLSQDLGFRYIIQYSTLTTVNGKVKNHGFPCGGGHSSEARRKRFKPRPAKPGATVDNPTAHCYIRYGHRRRNASYALISIIL
jgi:hypothetical protein